MEKLKLLFLLDSEVKPRPYLIWGCVLMVCKYVGEVVMYGGASGKFLTPLNFFSPLISSRYPGMTSGANDWFMPVMILWSLPFVWVGLSMTIRRLADAGKSPWLGLLFFIPVVNFVLMAILCFLPSDKARGWSLQDRGDMQDSIASPLMLVIIFAVLATGATWYNTNFAKVYGSSLFLAIPLVLGMVQGFLLNLGRDLSFRKSCGYVSLTIFIAHLLLLLFALEGIICLAMSLPVSLILGLIGSVFGGGIACFAPTRVRTPMFLLLALPGLPVVESHLIDSYKDSVVSEIEINVPPQAVWPNVVKFSDLPPTNDWLFQLGVAYPVRARIEGQGVGAIRRCEFSTGAFVEPITVWDEPNHLAFSVQFQPPPMKELSFYDHVDAPHLDGYFRSVRGEFRLIEKDGKTLLRGRTWYEMDMHPGWYWQIYGRWFIHRIHMRVLSHIKKLSEEKIAQN